MMTVTTNRVGTTKHLRVVGDLDLPRGDDLEARVGPLLVPGAQVALDLHDVEFADSSGIGALIELQQRSEQVGASIVLVDPSPVVRSVLELTGTMELFAVAS